MARETKKASASHTICDEPAIRPQAGTLRGECPLKGHQTSERQDSHSRNACQHFHKRNVFFFYFFFKKSTLSVFARYLPFCCSC